MAVEDHHPHLLRIRSEDMGTNYHLNIKDGSRKRPREVLCELNTLHINQEMPEINHILLQHTEKVRREMAELSWRQINRFTMAIGSEISKKLKIKNEEIERRVQANRVLEERLKKLAVEAQLWQNLAQSNEMTANMLRSDLEHVLANRREENGNRYIDEAESCCSGGEREEDKELNRSTRVCRYCREKVASVLLLPCRHLCLCDSCGINPLVVICPACGADRSGVFKVNLV